MRTLLAAIFLLLTINAASPQSTQLSQSEIDALRKRLGECWNPPAGARDAGRLVLRVLFKPDATVATPPQLVAGTPSPFGPAMAESAKRAILSCQPFTMLRPENYHLWKDIEITFDPREAKIIDLEREKLKKAASARAGFEEATIAAGIIAYDKTCEKVSQTLMNAALKTKQSTPDAAYTKAAWDTFEGYVNSITTAGDRAAGKAAWCAKVKSIISPLTE